MYLYKSITPPLARDEEKLRLSLYTTLTRLHKTTILHSGNKFRSFKDIAVFNVRAQSECKCEVTLELKSGIGKPNLQGLICYWCVLMKLFNYHSFFLSHFAMFFCRISYRSNPFFIPNAGSTDFFYNFIYNPIYSLSSNVPSGAQTSTIGNFCFISKKKKIPPSFPPHSPGSDSHVVSTPEQVKNLTEFPFWQPHFATGWDWAQISSKIHPNKIPAVVHI